MAKVKDYTVIGFWADNQQPFVTYVRSPNPRFAVVQAAHFAEAGEDLIIVEVIEGRHRGQLGNETVVHAGDEMRLVKLTATETD